MAPMLCWNMPPATMRCPQSRQRALEKGAQEGNGKKAAFQQERSPQDHIRTKILQFVLRPKTSVIAETMDYWNVVFRWSCTPSVFNALCPLHATV